MVNEFWKYWKQRWANASTNETVLKASANYQETRAAFLAGYQAAQQKRATDEAICTAKYHAALAEKGDTNCGVCGNPLRR